MTPNPLFDRFSLIWKDLNCPKETCRLNFDVLNALYSGPGRYYHNLEHVRQCLDELLLYPLGNKAFKMIIEFALWYHDAFYDVDGPRDNEKDSALLADEALSYSSFAGGISRPALRLEVYNLILATKHGNKKSRTPAETIIAEDYRAGRIKILQKFLDRDRIYDTDYFYDTHEKQARKNLTQEIKDLSQTAIAATKFLF